MLKNKVIYLYIPTDFDCVSVLSEHFDVCCLVVCDKQPIDAVLLYIWRMWSWCLASISICVGRTPVATDPTVDSHSWCSEIWTNMNKYIFWMNADEVNLV